MSDLRRPLLSIAATAALSLVIGACSGRAASPATASDGGASGGPTPAPSATAEDALEHETGASDVLLRYEEGGGFVMPTFAVTFVPHFTLYGDGTIVFRDPVEEAPPAEGSLFKSGPLKTAKL